MERELERDELVFLFRFTKEVPSLQVVQVRASFGTA
jgi:hypothetical protein